MMENKKSGNNNPKKRDGAKPFKKEGGKDKKYWGEKKPLKKVLVAKPENIKEDDGMIRLNKFISNAGVCSRREADELIKVGAISVNGKIVTEVGIKVHITDKIQYGKETLKAEKLSYVLLNKPKDFVANMEDLDNKKSVLELLKGLDKKIRVYPVGKMDKTTTGVLLLTNDGELMQKLIHPKHLVKKIYQVELNRNIEQDDFQAIAAGIVLEDGFVKPDEIAFVNRENRKEIGIELLTTKKGIVNRIFEHFDYKVVRLDRVYYAGLTKKDLPRGTWRFLTETEIRFLKMLG